MDRYAVFMDGAYVREVLRYLNESRLCYLKLSHHPRIAGELQRLRTYYYDCAPYARQEEATREAQKKFDQFIYTVERLSRFQVRLGRLQRYGEKYVQKKVDVLLAVDLVTLATRHQIVQATIVAGDSDFVPAIQVARDAGVIVQLCCYRPAAELARSADYDGPRVHRELVEACDEIIDIDKEFLSEIKQDG